MDTAAKKQQQTNTVIEEPVLNLLGKSRCKTIYGTTARSLHKYSYRWRLVVKSVILCLSKVGSPSALSDCDLNQTLRQAAHKSGRTLYVPSGALWGGQDIQRLNDSGGLKVTVALVT